MSSPTTTWRICGSNSARRWRSPDEFKWEWIGIPHIYNAPFYTYAYCFGQLLVLALYQQYKQEGAAFLPRYLRMLTYGGSEAPLKVLQRGRAGCHVSRRSGRAASISSGSMLERSRRNCPKEPSSMAETARVSPFAIFRNRNFSLMWTGQLISTMGTALTSLAASIYVFRLTDSASSVGLMLMATAAPSLLVGLFAGVFVDRYDRKKIMIVCD